MTPVVTPVLPQGEAFRRADSAAEKRRHDRTFARDKDGELTPAEDLELQRRLRAESKIAREALGGAA